MVQELKVGVTDRKIRMCLGGTYLLENTSGAIASAVDESSDGLIKPPFPRFISRAALDILMRR